MNIKESIRRILREEVTEDKNLYGEKLKVCSKNPMTGFYRDGYCKTGKDDTGSHTVCARVTEEFLEFTKSMGNNLDMLEPGDKWCLCAKRWEEANKEGVAPEMIKSSTNIKTFDIIDSDEQELDEYSRTLKNTRRQGVGLRFSKSAVKANPQRFRKYTRDAMNESDPKTGTGKKPEGSGRRLYTDENPNDTVSVKFRTKQDIIATLNKSSFKSKPHKRQSQIINLIHQRVRAAYQNAKDPETKKRLKTAYDYIETVKEKSKEKTIRLQKQKVNESENKKSGLFRAIEEDGLFQVMQDTGLSMGQIILKYDNLPREVFERYIKDFIKHDGYLHPNGFYKLGYEVEISRNKYVDTFYLYGDSVTVEIKELNLDSEINSGGMEYLENLTDEEIFNIVDDITSWYSQNDL